jgi:hypothetical protein
MEFAVHVHHGQLMDQASKVLAVMVDDTSWESRTGRVSGPSRQGIGDKQAHTLGFDCYSV